MKILIVIGMIIVFISAFFLFFIFDTSIRPQLTCMMDNEIECEDAGFAGLIIGMLMIGMFIVIDIITVYIIVNTAMAEPEAF